MACEIITIPSDRVLSLIEDHLRRAGIRRPICGIQICVEHPFGTGVKTHNEVPRLNVLLESAQSPDPAPTAGD